MRSLRVDLQLIVLALLTLAGVLAGAVNLWQQREYRLPDDGVVWVDFQNGVLARDIAAGSPAAAARLQVGDLLLSINGQSVTTTAEVSRQVFELGAGALGRYQVLRQGQSAPMEIGIILEAQQQAAGVRSYLQIVGVLYLLMGLFVLFRRFTAPRATHFYLFCLTSFILFAYSYTGKLDTFDWFIYWTSVTALLLQPALFAHFCLAYPQTQHGGGRKQQHGSGLQHPNRILAPTLAWIYGPAAVLWTAHLAAASGLLRFAAPLVEVRELLDRLAMGYLVVMFLAGIGLLAAAHRKAHSVVIRKQMLWVLGGSVLAIVPFAAIYAAPYFLGNHTRQVDEPFGPVFDLFAPRLFLCNDPTPAAGRGCHPGKRNSLHAGDRSAGGRLSGCGGAGGRLLPHEFSGCGHSGAGTGRHRDRPVVSARSPA